MLIVTTLACQPNQCPSYALVCNKVPRKGEANEVKALRRLLAPRCDGTLLVPEEVVKDWKDVHGGGRERVLHLWEQSSFNKVGHQCFSCYSVMLQPTSKHGIHG